MTKETFRLLVTSYDYRPSLGGVATCVYELLRAMSNQPGVQIRLIAPKHPDKFDEQSVDQSQSFETRRVDLSSQSALAVLGLRKYIQSEIENWKPDCILNTLWHPDGIATFLSGFPSYFLLVHGVEVLEASHNLKKRLRKALSPLKRKVFEGSTGIFCVSQFTKDLVIEHCDQAENKIKVVHNGVDARSFFPYPPNQDLVKALGLHGKKIFLTVSRLVDYKGIDFALQGLKQVVQKHPEVVYVICGTGPDRERLEVLSEQYGIKKNVVFTGPVSAKNLVDLYNLAECFVLLSRSDWVEPNVEGFGIAFLEAAACGKPSIAGNSGGIPDAVVHQQTGWLVNPTDLNEITQVMLDCIENPDKAKKFGQAGQKRALELFTWNNVAEKILSEIKRHVRN